MSTARCGVRTETYLRLRIELGVVVEEADDAGDDREVVEARASGGLGVDLEHAELDRQLEVLLELDLGEHHV